MKIRKPIINVMINTVKHDKADTNNTPNWPLRNRTRTRLVAPRLESTPTAKQTPPLLENYGRTGSY